MVSSTRIAWPTVHQWPVYDVIVLVFLLIAALLGSTIQFRSEATLMTPMNASPIDLQLNGFFDVEHFPKQARTFRWTQQVSEISIPNPGKARSLRVSLQGVPDRETPIRMRIGSSSFGIIVQPTLRSYDIALPASSSERLMLMIETPTTTIGGRDLGILVSDLQVVGGQQRFPPTVVLALIIAVIGSYTYVRFFGWSVPRAMLIVFVFEGLVVLWQLLWGWRYGWSAPSLMLLGGVGIANTVLEWGWFSGPDAPTIGRRWKGILPVIAFIVVSVGLSGLWLSIGNRVPESVVAGLTLVVVGGYLLGRQTNVFPLWITLGTLVIGGIGLGWGLAGGSLAWLSGPLLIVLGGTTLSIAGWKRGYFDWVQRYQTAVAIGILIVLLVIGGIFHSMLWAKPINDNDIYNIWLDVQRVASGENPYARILGSDMQHNDKYTTYFPLFYYLGAIPQLFGVETFDQWIVIWRTIFLTFNLGIAVVLFYTLYRAGILAFAVVATLFWFFNRWTIYVTVIRQIDFIPIFFFILSLVLFYRKRWFSLFCLAISLAIKQFAIFVVPFYIILIWKYTHSLKKVLLAAVSIGSVAFITSLPFIIMNWRAFVLSILFSASRQSARYTASYSVDYYLRTFFPHFSGFVTRLPTLILIVLLYFFAFRYKPGLYTCAFLALSIFVNFNPVLLNQYLTWVIPCTALMVCDAYQYVRQRDVGHEFG